MVGLGKLVDKAALAAMAVAVLVAVAAALVAMPAAADDGSLQVPGGTGTPIDTTTDPATPDPAPVHADGWELSGTTWTYWRNGAQVKGDWVDTDAKPATLGGAAGSHRYWIDQTGALAVNRVINPTTAADASATAYYAYASEYGYLVTGKKRVVTSSATRIYLARPSGDRIGELETGNAQGILKTAAYDNGTTRYYYIVPGRHFVSIKNDLTKARAVEVKGYGWVLPCFKGGYLLAGARKVIGQRVYLAKDNAVLQTGNVRVNGKATSILRTSKYDHGTVRCYYIDPTRHCAVAKSKPYLIKVKNAGYALSVNSKYGWLLAGAKKSIKPTTGTKKAKAAGIGTRVYLAKSNGVLESGNVKVNGKKTSILKTRKYDKKLRYYYIDPDRHCAVVRHRAVKASRYGWVLPCNKGGYLATGGRKVVDERLYLARANGKLETGNKLGFLSTKRYDPKGQRRRYFISPTTHAITYGKPALVSKDWGYVYAPNRQGYLLTGLTKVDSTHMLLIESNGRICNHRGWIVTNAFEGHLERYWLEPTSANANVPGARLGDFTAGGKHYRGLEPGGYVLRNTWERIGDTYYWVNNDGVFNYDSVVTRMLRRAQGYSSPTRYLLMVDVDNPRCIVFEGRQGNWGVKFIWDCCTGHPTSPTVSGTFSLGSKGYSFGEGNGYSCYYWSQISGGYLFHSQLYHPYTRKLLDGTIGRRCSHGCVRLWIDNAKWIQDHVPSGTTVACIY